MPDNPNGPGSAPASASSPTPGQGTAAATGAASPGSPGATDPNARLEALIRSVDALTTNQQNLRSLHDRQMNDLRQLLTPRPGNGTVARQPDPDPSHYGPGNGSAVAPPPDPGFARDPYEEQDIALIKFRQLNSDWQDYWPEMEPILQDPVRAAPFAIYRLDARTGQSVVDYYRSVEYLKNMLERDRLRKQKTEFDAARSAGNANNAAARRDAAISGQGASAPDTGPDWAKLSHDEKLRKLYELQPDLFDENDLPAALRKR